jgi:mannan endo-1,4-beta-mannosidase
MCGEETGGNGLPSVNLRPAMSDPTNCRTWQDSLYGHVGPGDTVDSFSVHQISPSADADNGRAPAFAFISSLGNGVNLQPSYDEGGDVDLGWALMQQKPNIRSVRIEIEPNQQTNAQRWIREAVSNGYAVVATYHKHAALGTDDPNELLEAAAWWVANYSSLQLEGRFRINLMNEWGSHAITAREFAAAYNEALAHVRTAYDGPIIIDIPGFGQEAQIAADAISGPATETITDPNIILSAHIYPDAWNNHEGRGMRTSDIDTLVGTGLDCVVGEFGDNGQRGNTDWLTLVNYAKSEGWPVLGWAWDGDGGMMNMISPRFQPFVIGAPQQYSATGYFNTIYDCL